MKRIFNSFLFVFLQFFLIAGFSGARAEIVPSEEIPGGMMSIQRTWSNDGSIEERDGAIARCNVWETQAAFRLDRKGLLVIYKRGCTVSGQRVVTGGVYFTNKLSLISL